jgi:hypothetical protein
VTTETPKITLGYWKTRAGNKVRVICVDAPGGYPVVACAESGEVTKYEADGKWIVHDTSHDLIAPWVDPPKVVECWAVFTEFGVYSSFRDKGSAERAANSLGCDSPPTIHHMREVNPAREAALEKVVKLARDFSGKSVSQGACWMRDALAALDAAEGVK